MQNTALILISLALFLLTLILGLLSFLVFKLFLRKPESAKQEIIQPNSSAFHPDIVDRINELKKIKPKNLDLFCPNHPDEPGEVSCSICDHYFCSTCIKPFKNMHVCKEHLPLLMHNEWEEVHSIKSSAQDPDEGVRLYDIKKNIYLNQNIPTYIETHYKINIDKDHIETYLVLFSIKENVTLVKEKLRSF